jgi:hypothetical protein
MRVLEKINLFVSIYIAQFLNIFRVSSWLPFFVLALFQALGLILITNLDIPGFKLFIFPLLKIFLPESVFHYPTYYLAAPDAYALFDNLLLGPTIWVITIAAATYKLAGLRMGQALSLGDGYKNALGIYGRLIILWFIQMILIGIVISIPSRIMAPYVYESPRFTIFVKILIQLAGFFIMALLIYTIPGMVIAQKRLGPAIANSLKLCYHNFFFTFFIIFVPGVLRIILDILTTNLGPGIINQRNPEIIVWTMFSNVGLGIFLNLFIYGTVAYAYHDISK